MRKYKLKNTRPKAPFGTGEAATLAAAGITAAATIASSIRNARATREAADINAQSIQTQAQRQADALAQVNKNNNELQIQNQEFVKAQNEENRELQKQTQMTLQMLAGQQNENDRLDASKIQVKCGGSLRKKANKGSNVLLRGSNNNLPFKVTDGGGVIPLGTTPEGGDLYEIVGDNHEHSHKANGTRKTGVGFKFANGGVIEGEGNQNSNLGELMYVTPNDAKFISKHSIAGFNPAKAVLSGMHPEVAFNEQETIKDMNNIPDSGKAKLGTMLHARDERKFNDWWNKTAPKGANADDYPTDYRAYFKNASSPSRSLRVKRAIGGDINTIAMPGLNMNNTDAVAGGVAYTLNNNRFAAKCGTSLRQKAKRGLKSNLYKSQVNYNPNDNYKTYNTWYTGDESRLAPETSYVPGNAPEVTLNEPINSTSGATSNPKPNYGPYAYQLAGAGITSLGNAIGVSALNSANRYATRTMANANTAAADRIIDAYKNLKGIDDNIVNRSDFRSAHAMPALVSPYVNVNPELAAVDRSLQRRLTNVNNYSTSGAAALNRAFRAETDAYDQRSNVYSQANKLRDARLNENAERITKVANENADRDTQALRDYLTGKLEVAKYNADIRNQSIIGIGQTSADNISQNGNLWGNYYQSLGSNLAEANNKSAEAWSKTLASIGKEENDKNNIYAGARETAGISAAIGSKDIRRMKLYYDMYKDGTDPEDKRYSEILKRALNSQGYAVKCGGSLSRHKLKYGGRC